MTLKIGAHVSIAGGVYNAIDSEAALGGNCGQIFTHSPRMWKPPQIPDADAAEFKRRRDAARIGPWISHVTYLVNLASSSQKLYQTSVAMMQKEVEAAELLGLEYLCVHPGTHSGTGEEAGIKQIVKALDSLVPHAKTVTVLLENTAGAGSSIAYKFENLKQIIEQTKLKRVGLLMDTQHTFASGHDIAKPDVLKALLKKIDELVGLDKLHALHLNDSMSKCGDRVDRHEHIGEGYLGKGGMRNILTNPALRKLPFILETPVDERKGHKENMAAARALAE